MDTKKFKTRTEIIERNNGYINGVWPLAIDLGYSSVKLFAPNKIMCFPSYARKIDREPQFIGENVNTNILYKDLKSGDLWAVGELAQSLVKNGDTSDSENILYGRERYYSPLFNTITNVALGLGMMGNSISCPIDNTDIRVQTGLPERYMDDEDLLKDVIEGRHNFAIKIGSGQWIDFDIRIKRENIDVMSQPKGTLLSTVMDKYGQFIKDAQDYLNSNVLVFDPGFGTLDIFTLKKGRVDGGETFDNLGMKRVLQETAKLIKDKYGVNIQVSAMQECLDTGSVQYTNRKEHISRTYSIETELATACFNVCKEAFDNMNAAMDLGSFKYFIITGGTGSAWSNKLSSLLNGFDNLKVVFGNQNDDLPLLYSNVRGYYLSLYNKILKERN